MAASPSVRPARKSTGSPPPAVAVRGRGCAGPAGPSGLAAMPAGGWACPTGNLHQMMMVVVCAAVHGRSRVKATRCPAGCALCLSVRGLQPRLQLRLQRGTNKMTRAASPPSGLEPEPRPATPWLPGILCIGASSVEIRLPFHRARSAHPPLERRGGTHTHTQLHHSHTHTLTETLRPCPGLHYHLGLDKLCFACVTREGGGGGYAWERVAVRTRRSHPGPGGGDNSFSYPRDVHTHTHRDAPGHFDAAAQPAHSPNVT